MRHILDCLLCAYYECSAAKFWHVVVPGGKCIVLELGPPAIDKPPLARDNVHNWFNIGSGKICGAKKKKNGPTPLRSWVIARERRVAAICGKHDTLEKRMVCRMVRRLQLCILYVQSGDTYR